jgi:uncharacterized protein YndB with AHSA1/START domain
MPEENENKPIKRDLVLTRVFDAPLEKLLAAWTVPQEFMKWWGPKDFTSPFAKMDVRIGGKYLAAMRSPEGKDYWSTGTYLEVVPMRKIVASDSFSDKDGNVVSAEFYGMSADWPREMMVMVVFEKWSNKSKLTITYPDVSRIDPKGLSDMKEGWNQSLDKLAGVLEKD